MVKKNYTSLTGGLCKRICDYMEDMDTIFFRYLSFFLMFLVGLGILALLISWIVNGNWQLSAWILGLWLLAEVAKWLDI